MSAADCLDEIRARYVEWHQDRGDHSPSPSDWQDADPGESMDHCIVRNDVPAMHAALRAVLDLHVPVEIEPSDTICQACSTLRGSYEHLYYSPTESYPCPTVRAVTDHLSP